MMEIAIVRTVKRKIADRKMAARALLRRVPLSPAPPATANRAIFGEPSVPIHSGTTPIHPFTGIAHLEELSTSFKMTETTRERGSSLDSSA